MRHFAKTVAICLCLALSSQATRALDIEYPQVIRTKYEAADARAGGNFVIWSEREKIFHRFYRIDKSASGSGLGLAITKHLVLQQRGSIHVESQPGTGATFVVRLPKAR